jgi:serine-type D-Ala-D-Ala endopeptidase (penicillin-binding protein 7)
MKKMLRTVLLAACLPFSLPAAHAAGGGITPLPDPSRLQLASVHALVAPLNPGTPVYAKFADQPAPIASITKLMTAMVVLDSKQPLDEWLPLGRREDNPPKNAFSRIRLGSEARRGDLLQITLMSSENLAAYALARHHPGGREAFIQAMNDKARALGMEHTQFVDPSGLWPENRASAIDLLKLVRAAYSYPEIREMSTGASQRVHFRNPRYSLDFGNTNALVHSARWDVALSKTGYLTEAGRCLVMVADVRGEPMVMVLLDSFGARTPLGDAGRIRSWLETGSSGVIAGAAQDYERSRTTALAGVGALAKP